MLAPTWNVPGLHKMIFRDYPVVTTRIDAARIADPAYANAHAEAAAFTLNWASATGTAILLAAIASALFLRVSFAQFLTVALATLRRMASPLVTIMLMLALGFVTRYGGMDATLGLAFTRHRLALPVLRGAARLARRRPHRLGHQLERPLRQPAEDHRAAAAASIPVLVCTANSTGGVMGKMIDAQSIVVVDGVHGTDGPGRPHPALRLLAQRRAGDDHGCDRDAASVRIHVDDPVTGVRVRGAGR